MNQQQYLGGGLTPISSEPLKRRRGRPRKDESVAIKPPQADVSKGKARVDGVRDDVMIGQAVTGVLEGMFDAGYFLSVRVGESDTRLKGLVFQPGKFVPVTTDNDVAPRAKMYSRVDVQSPIISSSSNSQVDPVPFILVEKPGLVPMGCENKANVVVEAANEDEAIPKKKHFGSPSLELALSNTSFGDTHVSKPAVDEGQQNIPLQNLDPSLASSIMKDVLKISIDVDKEEEKTHVGASFGFHEEIESGREDVMLDPVAKKPKIDEQNYSSEVASSESVLQPEGITAPKELVDTQGFHKPMETD